MIVLLNMLVIPFSIGIAKCLTAHYDDHGAFIDLHRAQEIPCLTSLERMAKLIPSEAITKHVQMEKRSGHTSIVLNGTFLAPEDLRECRVALSACDDEIYAFRLPLAEALLTRVDSSILRKELVDISMQWAKAQDAGAHYGDMGYEIAIESLHPDETAQRIWNDVHAPVELVDYREEWPGMFATEKARILEALPDLNISVEHIGSTAIPGMPAKPIVDMLITIKHLDDAVSCIQPLRELGYAFIDYAQNIDRRFFRKGTPRSHHIHIVTHNSPSAHAYLRFRDALRTDAALRQEYLQLKLIAMQQFKHQRALYGERKSALIRKALT